MKTYLEEKYGIKVNELKKIKDEYIISDENGFIYYFIQTNETEKNIIEKSKMINDYSIRRKYHQFIMNKNGYFISIINQRPFILMKVKNINNTINLLDIIDFNIYINKNILIDWDNIWEQNINYYKELYQKNADINKVIKYSFWYYLAMAENAILLFRKNKDSNSIKSISHKQIFYPNYDLNYYNPLNIKIDYRVRDVAEYLKSSFFSGNSDITELEIALKKTDYSVFECNMLFSRLLYPNYFFKSLEKYLNNELSDDEIIDIIKKASLYEDFLNRIKNIIKKYQQIADIKWITKKHEQL